MLPGSTAEWTARGDYTPEKCPICPFSMVVWATSEEEARKRKKRNNESRKLPGNVPPHRKAQKLWTWKIFGTRTGAEVLRRGRGQGIAGFRRCLFVAFSPALHPGRGIVASSQLPGNRARRRHRVLAGGRRTWAIWLSILHCEQICFRQKLWAIK